MPASSSLVWFFYVVYPLLWMLVVGVIFYWLYTKQWTQRGAKWFGLLLVTGTIWAVFVVAFFVATDPTLQYVLLSMATIAAMSAFAVFVVFTSRYTSRNFHRHPFAQLVLGVMVGGTVLVTIADPFTGLLYSEIEVMREPIDYLAVVYGPGFVAVVAVTLLAVGYSYFVLISYLFSTTRSSVWQLLLLFLGFISLAIPELLGTLGVFPAAEFSHVVYGAGGFAVFTTFALFRLGLLDIQPVARNAIVDSLLDPIVVIDSDGRLVDYNRASVRLWPSVDGSIGEPIASPTPALAGVLEEAIVDPDSAAPMASIEAGESTSKISLTLDGEEREYSVSISPVTRHESTDVGWYAVVLQDVTAIERSRQQLQTQNKRLDQVASTISHDLRNPIQVADGHLALLETQIEALATDQSRLDRAFSTLESIRRSFSRMEETIQNLLTLAKEGKAVEETTTLELETMARVAWSTLETGDASLVIDGNRPVEADQERLRTILEHCFQNALEHGPSSVTVSVGPTADGFFLEDDGPGVPDALTEEIFDTGYAIDTEDMGFGLSIVRTLVEAHGWTVTLDTDYDAGARFVFDVTGNAVGTESTFGLVPSEARDLVL